MTKTLTIIRDNFHDIPLFYAEINRVFMSAGEWTLAPASMPCTTCSMAGTVRSPGASR